MLPDVGLKVAILGPAILVDGGKARLDHLDGNILREDGGVSDFRSSLQGTDK